jgi:hypothetical protein
LAIVNGASVMSDQKARVRTRDERLQIMLSPEELSMLDDFRFKKRMPSRASAIRELLRRGLSAEGFTTAALGTKSSEFGVAGKAPNGRAAK